MTGFTLVGPDGSPRFELPAGRTVVLGRAAGCDVPIFDPTISRRHAEVSAGPDGVQVHDLDSSNGTYVNGARVTHAVAHVGDSVTFGRLAFDVALTEPRIVEAPASPASTASLRAETIVARRVVPPREALETAMGRALAHDDPNATRAEAPLAERDGRRLALLVEVSKQLGRPRDTDALLADILRTVFEILEVDRAALLLCDDTGELTPKLSLDRQGRDVTEAVPRSIARRALEEKVALLSDDVPADARFGGHSIVLQQVRSALCAPLVGGDGDVLGVLYVDNVTLSRRFDEADLDFLVAFAGIAAVAIENSRMGERIRREALVRSNFERYFAPQLAARIAGAPGEVRLGGERRDVAVLFADIRGFTPLAESLDPHAMARLLTEYFTEMAECVFRHGGTLDKFMGDAVMAQWGAPLANDDDADRAVQAAVEMQAAVCRLNAAWRDQGRAEIGIGVGIGYGPAFAGNIGSERRLEYTVIGDIVNTASRVCAAAQAGEILLTEELRARLRHPLICDEREPLVLKGKRQPVPVYRVMA
ncbi:MAG TPA: adenylate/guanylate cyclase domain-containing protein [Gemmatimonadaceae bacterium]|nr:adenylate/guanylate cyclase domain-containing protein [Gemmatimonadaceae bacterium]